MKRKVFNFSLMASVGLLAFGVAGLSACNETAITSATVSLNKNQLTMQVGDSYQLKASVSKGYSGELRWFTSNDSVAYVSSGYVFALGEGEATITAAFGGGFAECKVTVESGGVGPVETEYVRLNPTSQTVNVGSSFSITASVMPADTTLTWTSSDASIAEVNAAGLVTGASLDTTTGVITFEATGYFDISVVNGAISIAEYEPNDFFCLNRINLSSVSNSSNVTSNEISNQNTGIVLEVEFSCNNPFTTNLTLEVTNTLSAYTGVALYVSNTQLDDSDAYGLLNANRSLLSNSTVISDINHFDVPANSGTESYFYAYILVDYIPGNFSQFVDNYAGHNLSFYLKCTQPGV